MQVTAEKISVRSVCKMCGIAIVLWSSVIKSGCNQSENKIQTSELEPVISSRVPPPPPYTSKYLGDTLLET
jgi:hypothetical protein